MRISDWSSDVCSSDRSEERTPTCGKSRLRERAKDDVAERREAVQDERERTDVEDLADQSAEHIIPAAQSPERSEERRGGKEWVRRVKLGGRRIHKKKNIQIQRQYTNQ